MSPASIGTYPYNPWPASVDLVILPHSSVIVANVDYAPTFLDRAARFRCDIHWTIVSA